MRQVRRAVVMMVVSIAASARAQPQPQSQPSQPPQPSSSGPTQSGTAPAAPTQPAQTTPPTPTQPTPPAPLASPAPGAPGAPPAPDAPLAPVSPEVEHSARLASNLARDGHCDIALDYGKTIQAQAPDYYTRVFVADPYIAACIAGTAPRPRLPPPSAPSPEIDEAYEAHCPRPYHRRLYLAPSLFTMNGSMWSSGDSSHSTSNEDTFHRIAVGALLRQCAPPDRGSLGGHVAATAALNTNVSGVGLEAELDYGVGPYLRGGLRFGFEAASNQHILSAGGRVHAWDMVFVGIDGYTARDGPYRSRGVMLGFGLEGRPAQWVLAIEGGFVLVAAAAFLAGAGPD